MKKLAILIISTIAGAAAYGQYVTPVGTAQWFKKQVYIGADTTNPTAIFRSNGKVGIGTATPTETLTLNGTLMQSTNRWGYKFMMLSNTLGHGLAVQHISTGTYSALMVADTNYVLMKSTTALTSPNTYFNICSSKGLLLGFGNTLTSQAKNIIRFDSISKYMYGADMLSTTPNTRWLDSSNVARAGIYNNGWLSLASSNNPSQALDVRGSAKVDSSLILRGELFIDADTAITLPNNITSVIIDYTTDVDTADITLPPNPVDGQLVSISVNTIIDMGMKVLPNAGQTLAFNGVRSRAVSMLLRYREISHKWYLW